MQGALKIAQSDWEKERQTHKDERTRQIEDAQRASDQVVNKVAADRIAADTAWEQLLAQESAQRVQVEAERQKAIGESKKLTAALIEASAREQSITSQLDALTESLTRAEKEKRAVEVVNDAMEAERKAAELTSATLLDAAKKAVSMEVGDDYKHEIKQLQGLVSVAKADLGAVQTELQRTRKENENDRVAAQLAAKQLQEENGQHLRMNQEENEQRQRQLQDELRVGAEEVDSVTLRSKELEKRLKASEDERQSLRREIDTARGDVDNVIEQRVENQRKALVDEHSAAKTEWTLQLKLLAIENESMVQQANKDKQARADLELQLVTSGECAKDLTRKVRMLTDQNDAIKADSKSQHASFAIDINEAEVASNARMEAAVATAKMQAEARMREDAMTAMARSEMATTSRVEKAVLAARMEAQTELEAKMQTFVDSIRADQQSAMDKATAAGDARVKAAVDAAMETSRQETSDQLAVMRRELEARATSAMGALQVEHRATLAELEEDSHRKFKSIEASADAAYARAETTQSALDGTSQELRKLGEEKAAMQVEMRRLQDIQAAHQDVLTRETKIFQLKEDLAKQKAEEQMRETLLLLEQQTEKSDQLQLELDRETSWRLQVDEERNNGQPWPQNVEADLLSPTVAPSEAERKMLADTAAAAQVEHVERAQQAEARETQAQAQLATAEMALAVLQESLTSRPTNAPARHRVLETQMRSFGAQNKALLPCLKLQCLQYVYDLLSCE